jgi:hypothetical protein
VDVVDPAHLFGIGFDSGQVEIDDDGFLVTAHHNAGQRHAGTGIDLLMGQVRRNIDEVARARLGGVFEPLAPPHPGATGDHVDHAFDVAVMVRPGLGVRIDNHGACPQPLGARERSGDRGSPPHSRGLCGVGVQRVGVHDPHALQAPVGVISGHNSSCFQATKLGKWGKCPIFAGRNRLRGGSEIADQPVPGGE